MVHRLSHATRKMTSRHKALANALFGLVQLRFRIPYGAVQDLCDLAMTVTVKLMQFKNRAVAEGEGVEGALESDAVKRMFQALVLPAELAFAGFALAGSV